jgi:hypothetical protein
MQMKTAGYNSAFKCLEQKNVEKLICAQNASNAK